MQPLSGLRIIEGSAFVAAPSGGMTLAQLGADVIRFDQIGGGLDYARWPLTATGTSLYWTGLNKGKRSIALDLRSSEAKELLTELICAPGDDRGVFLTNFPASGWMSYSALAERRSDLIMVNVVGNHDGSTAVDYTVNCAVGFPSVTGPSTSQDPVNHVLPAWDLICGQTAALAVLAADRYRGRTAQGSYVPIALSDVALSAVSALGHVGEAIVLGEQRARYGNDLYGAFGRDFPTADGRRVMAVAISPKQWRGLVAATGTNSKIAELEAKRGVDLGSDEGARFAVRDELFAILAPWFANRSLSAIRAALDAEGVCWGPYQTFLELVTEDRRCSEENPLFSTVDQPGVGPVLQAGSPIRFANTADASAAPVLGQHTEEVLLDDLGLSTAEFAALVDRGIAQGI